MSLVRAQHPEPYGGTVMSATVLVLPVQFRHPLPFNCNPKEALVSFAFLEDLMIVTIINFVAVFSTTILILYTIDKIKEKFGKK